MRDQTISALRWLSVLPAAIACYIVVSLLLLAKVKIWSDPGIDFLLIAVFPTVGFLIGGVMTAPAKRFLTAVVLTVLYVLVESSVAVFAPNPANSTSRVSVSIVYLHRDVRMDPKRRAPEKGLAYGLQQV